MPGGIEGIGGAGASGYVQQTPPVQQQVVKGGRDSDGDNDGSKPGEVEKPKATATQGNNVNTFA